MTLFVINKLYEDARDTHHELITTIEEKVQKGSNVTSGKNVLNTNITKWPQPYASTVLQG